jgi:hypothetical protein
MLVGPFAYLVYYMQKQGLAILYIRGGQYEESAGAFWRSRPGTYTHYHCYVMKLCLHHVRFILWLYHSSLYIFVMETP